MDTTTGFYGGEASLKYSILSSGKPGQPSNARFDAEWRDVDLADYSDFLLLRGHAPVAADGAAATCSRGRWGVSASASGDGYSEVIPPAGAEVLAGMRASHFASGPDRGGVHPPIGHLPIAGEVTYRYDHDWLEFSDGRFSTPDTDVTFSGRTAWGDNSRIPFQCDEHRSAGKRSRAGRHDDGVRRADETDYRRRHRRVLRRDDRGAQPAARRGPFRRRRHARVRRQLGRRRSGSRHPELVCRRHRRPHAEGRRRASSSTAASRSDFRGATREKRSTAASASRSGRPPTSSMRSISTTTTSRAWCRASITSTARIRGRSAFGTLTIDDGIAYGEPFETASGSLRFEGNGVRIDGIQMQKSGGTAEGAAFVGWNGTYSFNATGRRIPLEGVKAMTYPQTPLTGLLEFNADGTGTFDVPRYQFRGRIRDLFIADEGVGEVTGPARRARRQHDDRDRSGVSAPRGVGHGPHRSDRDRRTPTSRCVSPTRRSIPTRARSRSASRRSRRRSAAARCASSASSRTRIA